MKTRIFNSISEVPAPLWNALLDKRSCAFSHEFWQIIERSGMNDFRYWHVLILDDNDTPVAQTSFYSVTTDIAIFAPLPLRVFLAKVRKVFPNFLKLRMIEWGTPITVSSPPFVARDGISQREIIRHVDALLRKIAKTEEQFLIVVRDFEPNAESAQKDFQELGYHWVDSLPNTYMDVTWSSTDEYRASMKSYYRSKLLKHLRRNQEQNIHYDLVENFDHLADQLCKQWMVVHEQANEFQREVLTPNFYREFSRCMGTRSRALLFYRRDELVGHALLLQDGQLLRWLYFGRNEATNDSLYLYVTHAVIETAILLGATKLEMGLTTYAIKQDHGALVSPIKLALRAVSPLINPFVGWFYPLLNQPPKLGNKSVFKNSKHE